MTMTHEMETQMSSHLEHAEMENARNDAKQRDEIEKEEAERQKWLRIKKKPKRKRVLPIIQQLPEGIAQIPTDNASEEADERFAQSVAEEIKALAIDEFQMVPRQIGIKIWQYPWLCCANWFIHRRLMREYRN
ncbi:hypothetical protein LOAG_12561, partial [Loa loa]